MRLTETEKRKLMRTIDGLAEASQSYGGQLTGQEKDDIGQVIHALTEIHDGVERDL